nr:hypothetical protein [Tanacetum cinerariifolium]GEY78697.1 hypothetical protein [Tanacetum cinerariifolium]
MVDSQLEGKGAQRTELEGTGMGSRKGPSEPAQLAQMPHSPTFIKENINVLRMMIKEHDQHAKAKANPKKLVYGSSNEEDSDSLRSKGLLERLFYESSGTSRTRDRARSTGKSQRSLSRSSELAKKLNDKISKIMDKMFKRSGHLLGERRQQDRGK